MAEEYLEVNSISLNQTTKWWIADLAPLRATGLRRGEVKPMPYVAGAVAYTHRLTVTDMSLELFVTGATWSALETNEATLLTSVVGGEAVTTVQAKWHKASGSTWTADVIVLGLNDPSLVGFDPGPVMRYSLDLRIPAGRFKA